MTPWDALGGEIDLPANVEINKRNHAWAADSIPERNKWAETIQQKLEKCEAEEPLTYRASLMTSRIWSSLKDSLPIILLPPVLLFIVGYVGMWIIRGFQATR